MAVAVAVAPVTRQLCCRVLAVAVAVALAAGWPVLGRQAYRGNQVRQVQVVAVAGKMVVPVRHRPLLGQAVPVSLSFGIPAYHEPQVER